MKKFFSIFLVILLLVSIIGYGVAGANSNNKNKIIDNKISKLKELEKWQKDKNFIIKFDKNGKIDFIKGKLSDKPLKSEIDIERFINSKGILFDLEQGNFKNTKMEEDKLGYKHYRMQLFVENIPVYGDELIVHLNRDDYVYYINGNVKGNIKNKKYSKDIKINETKAIKIAQSYLNLNKEVNYEKKPNAKLYLYNIDKTLKPVYLVNLQFIEPYLANWKVFVDANTGKVVDKYNGIANEATTGTGVGVNGQTRTLNTYLSGGIYYLYDTTKPMSGQIRTYTANNGTSIPGSYVTDSDNNFNASSQAAAVDAHYYAGLVYDYYYNTFGRNSFDNNGSSIISTVNYSTNYNNAGWTGSQMIYGDGDGIQFAPLSGALDVVAHELTHAVTEYTANLEYRDQSGALNESFSDVFGVIIEGDTSDWLLGEDIYTPGTPGDALRSMSDPTLYNQPDHMDDYYYTSEDNGGVHTNSGIPNKAFYLIASNIGFSKSGKIYYRALTQYLTSQSDFNDARDALLQSAEDLYGYGSTEYNAVADGFEAVGIGSSSGNDNYEPNDTLSSAYGPIDSGVNYDSFISSSSDIDYYKFDISNTGNISVSLTNLPGDYDIYLLDSSGIQLAKSENANTSDESISYDSTSTGTFYIKVIGWNGAYSTATPYRLNVTYPTGSSSYQWYYESASLDTPHNYPNYYNDGHTYTKPGALKVAVHFSQFSTEQGYDFVEIRDKNGTLIAKYDGTKSPFWAIVDGDTINVTLISDYSVTDYGYHIDQVAYYSDTQLITD